MLYSLTNDTRYCVPSNVCCSATLSVLSYPYETSVTMKLILEYSDAKCSELSVGMNNFRLNCI